jgi:hypothetical protein
MGRLGEPSNLCLTDVLLTIGRSVLTKETNKTRRVKLLS